MDLKTDYKNISWTGLRKYEMIDNGDGTVSFRDVTQYTNVEDSNILAQVLNSANDAINRMMNGEIFYTEAEVDALLQLKQNLLTFDDVPTAGSNNPVKSSGIKSSFDAVNTRIDNLSVFSFYICGSGEYDPVTGQPTIQNPDTSTFYLVPTGSSPDVFTEWVYINNAWEKFGSTTVDLSNYVTTSDLQDALDDKQDVLTFDNTPTDNSDNPVTSDGIHDALSGKSDTGHNHDSRYYTESETDVLLLGKSDVGHNHDSRYYTESEVDTLLSEKSDTSSTYTSAQVDTLLSAKVDNTSIGSMAAEDDAPSDNKEYVRKNGDWSEVSGGGGSTDWSDITNKPSTFPPEAHNHDDRYYTESEIDTALSGKQNTLTFDNSPTSGSANPVKSGGIYTALAGKQPTLTFDNSPTSGSANPVKSGGIYTALAGKQATLTFDNSPTSESANPVKSGGIFTAFAKEIMYFTSQTVSVASSAQIMRIPASGTNSNITTNTVVLECTFANPERITSDVSWQSYAGYITFTGTCKQATTANVTLGTKGN